ncbi:hypothetical protein ABZZ79_27620 [Streptomyces sp. NPDC006458]|uniref:hypothetical protein n=1 Tax=Streptomyces sp. NPDC006458 TaxID=3154302 RepID=UPI0033A0C6FD
MRTNRLVSTTTPAPTTRPDLPTNADRAQDGCTSIPARRARPAHTEWPDPQAEAPRVIGAAVGMTGAYAGRLRDSGLMEFRLEEWHGERIGLAFYGDGTWPTLNLEEVDELIGDMASHLADLIAARRHLADLLGAGR